jgi:hypothetical protein
VFYLALVDDGHRLEATVWVLSNAEPFKRRREFHRTCIVEKQKRTERRSQVRVSEERSDREPVSYPMTVHTALDAAELFY